MADLRTMEVSISLNPSVSEALLKFKPIAKDFTRATLYCDFPSPLCHLGSLGGPATERDHVFHIPLLVCRALMEEGIRLEPILTGDQLKQILQVEKRVADDEYRSPSITPSPARPPSQEPTAHAEVSDVFVESSLTSSVDVIEPELVFEDDDGGGGMEVAPKGDGIVEPDRLAALLQEHATTQPLPDMADYSDISKTSFARHLSADSLSVAFSSSPLNMSMSGLRLPPPPVPPPGLPPPHLQHLLTMTPSKISPLSAVTGPFSSPNVAGNLFSSPTAGAIGLAAPVGLGLLGATGSPALAVTLSNLSVDPPRTTISALSGSEAAPSNCLSALGAAKSAPVESALVDPVDSAPCVSELELASSVSKDVVAPFVSPGVTAPLLSHAESTVAPSAVSLPGAGQMVTEYQYLPPTTSTAWTSAPVVTQAPIMPLTPAEMDIPDGAPTPMLKVKGRAQLFDSGTWFAGTVTGRRFNGSHWQYRLRFDKVKGYNKEWYSEVFFRTDVSADVGSMRYKKKPTVKSLQLIIPQPGRTFNQHVTFGQEGYYIGRLVENDPFHLTMTALIEGKKVKFGYEDFVELIPNVRLEDEMSARAACPIPHPDTEVEVIVDDSVSPTQATIYLQESDDEAADAAKKQARPPPPPPPQFTDDSDGSITSSTCRKRRLQSKAAGVAAKKPKTETKAQAKARQKKEVEAEKLADAQATANRHSEDVAVAHKALQALASVGMAQTTSSASVVAQTTLSASVVVQPVSSASVMAQTTSSASVVAQTTSSASVVAQTTSSASGAPAASGAPSALVAPAATAVASASATAPALGSASRMSSCVEPVISASQAARLGLSPPPQPPPFPQPCQPPPPVSTAAQLSPFEGSGSQVQAVAQAVATLLEPKIADKIDMMTMNIDGRLNKHLEPLKASQAELSNCMTNLTGEMQRAHENLRNELEERQSQLRIDTQDQLDTMFSDNEKRAESLLSIVNGLADEHNQTRGAVNNIRQELLRTRQETKAVLEESKAALAEGRRMLEEMRQAQQSSLNRQPQNQDPVLTAHLAGVAAERKLAVSAELKQRIAAEAEQEERADEAEKQRLAEADANHQRRIAAQFEERRLAAKAEQEHLAAEAEQKRLTAEAEQKRLTAEAEQKRLTAEAEERRVAAEAEERRLAAEAEERRVAAEAEERRVAAEAEERRLAAEAELQRRREAEAEQQRLAEADRQRMFAVQQQEALRQRVAPESSQFVPPYQPAGESFTSAISTAMGAASGDDHYNRMMWEQYNQQLNLYNAKVQQAMQGSAAEQPTYMQLGQVGQGQGQQGGQFGHGQGMQGGQFSHGQGMQGAQFSHGQGMQGGQFGHGQGMQGGQFGPGHLLSSTAQPQFAHSPSPFQQQFSPAFGTPTDSPIGFAGGPKPASLSDLNPMHSPSTAPFTPAPADPEMLFNEVTPPSAEVEAYQLFNLAKQYPSLRHISTDTYGKTLLDGEKAHRTKTPRTPVLRCKSFVWHLMSSLLTDEDLAALPCSNAFPTADYAGNLATLYEPYQSVLRLAMTYYRVFEAPSVGYNYKLIIEHVRSNKASRKRRDLKKEPAKTPKTACKRGKK